MQCTNHLKQLGLALHNYHDVQNSFPLNATLMSVYASYRGTPGDVTKPGYPRLGAMPALTPYMEAGAIYDLIQQETRSCAVGSDDAPNTANLTAYGRQIPTLLCPSDGTGKNPPNRGAALGSATNNYMFSQGDWPDLHCYAGGGTNALRADPPAGYAVNPRGIFSGSWKGGYKGMGGVTDGTSNTIAIAEKLIGEGGGGVGSLITRAVAVFPSATAADLEDPASVGEPLLCNSASVVNGKYYAVSGFDESGGRRWADGVAVYSGFCTILPPNGPSCGYNYAEQRVVSSASSNHTGGVNALRFDGSVHFVSDTINAITAGLTGTIRPVRSGRSPFGVWGAMGSIKGGESVSP